METGSGEEVWDVKQLKGRWWEGAGVRIKSGV